MNVMVDRQCFDSVTKYFDLPESSLLPVVEDVFCEEDLEKIKRHMIDYTNKERNLLEEHFLELQSKGKVINMWPDGKYT